MILILALKENVPFCRLDQNLKVLRLACRGSGALSFNYFFTEPLHSFQIAEVEDSINFVVFIIVAILISELAVYVILNNMHYRLLKHNLVSRSVSTICVRHSLPLSVLLKPIDISRQA